MLLAMSGVVMLILAYPVQPSPSPEPLEVWSDVLGQYVDYFDSFDVLPKRFKYLAYLGSD